MNTTKDDPAPDERVCFNCRHMLWMVGIGRGVECDHTANSPPGAPRYAIPSRRHTCEHFDPKTAGAVDGESSAS